MCAFSRVCMCVCVCLCAWVFMCLCVRGCAGAHVVLAGPSLDSSGVDPVLRKVDCAVLDVDQSIVDALREPAVKMEGGTSVVLYPGVIVAGLAALATRMSAVGRNGLHACYPRLQHSPRTGRSGSSGPGWLPSPGSFRYTAGEQ